MAGTEDTSPGTEDPEDRRDPFLYMPAGDKYHATLDGAVHGDFGNEYDFYHKWIMQLTIAFFDCYLLDNKRANSWLSRKIIMDITPYILLEIN